MTVFLQEKTLQHRSKTCKFKQCSQHKRYHRKPPLPQKALVCCGKTFTKSASLKRHVARTHAVMQVIECEKCKKTFRHTDNYLQHKKSHTKKPRVNKKMNNKRFVCEHCNAKFNRKSSIRLHFTAQRCVIHK